MSLLRSRCAGLGAAVCCVLLLSTAFLLPLKKKSDPIREAPRVPRHEPSPMQDTVVWNSALRLTKSSTDSLLPTQLEHAVPHGLEGQRLQNMIAHPARHGEVSAVADDEDYSWMLPSHSRRLFCPGDDSDLRDVPSKLEGYSISESLMTFKECDKPVLVVHLPPGFGTNSLQVERTVTRGALRVDISHAEHVHTSTSSNTSEILSYCVWECLRSPYCKGIQGPFDGGSCHLLRSNVDVPPGRIPQNDVAVSLLGHHREFRPSLILSHPRLVAYNGPTEVIRLDNTSGGFCSACTWELRPAGANRDLIQDLQVRVNLRVADSSLTDFSSFGVRLTGDCFLVDLRHIPLGSVVGQQIVIAVEPTHHQRALHSMRWEQQLAVHREATRMVIVTLPSASNSQIPPQEPQELVVSHDCAPLLRPNECCLTNVAIRHIAEGHVVTFAASMASRTGELMTIEVDDSDGCFKVAGGQHAVLRHDGGAEFTHMILARQPNPAPSCESPNHTIVFTVRQYEGPTLKVRAGVALASQCGRDHVGMQRPAAPSDGLPVLLSTTAHECQRCVEQQLENFHSFVPKSLVVLRLGGMFTIYHVPLFNNTAAHPRVYAHAIRYGSLGGNYLAHLHALNIHYMSKVFPFVQYSHVVLVSSNEMFVRAGLEQYVKRFAMSRATTVPRGDSGVLLQHMFPNVRYPAYGTDDDLALLGTTFGFWSRQFGGVQDEFHVAAVMRRYNMTKWPREQVYLEGSFFSTRVARVFARLMLVDFGAVDLPSLPRAHNRSRFRVIRPFPTSEILPYLFLHTLCDDDSPLHAEPLQNWHQLFNSDGDNSGALLKPGSLKCGDHVSTVTWRSPQWTVTNSDLVATRCSPFDVPMGLKRVPRSENHPTRRLIVALQRNSTRAAMLRDPASLCEGV